MRLGGGEAVGLDRGESVKLGGGGTVRYGGNERKKQKSAERTVGVRKSISPHTSHRGVFWCFSGYGLNRRAPHYPQWIRSEGRLSESGMGLYGVVAEMSS